MKIAIVAPAYNEEKIIKKFLKSVLKVKYPVYVVDDGSTDKTFQALQNFHFPGSNFHLLRHKINLGKGAAMKTGAEAAFSDGIEAVIFMDTDSQHDIKDLPKFTKKLEEGYDVVFGSRKMGTGAPLVRNMGNRLASLLISFLFGVYVSDILCGFRAITKKAYKIIVWESAGYAVETEMVIRCAKVKLKHCEVPVTTLYLDVFKGVSVMDSVGIFFNVLLWKVRL